MEWKTQLKRYSIFGNYEHFDAANEKVQKIYIDLLGKNFMPNVAHVIKFEPESKDFTKAFRPQFINVELGCEISLLPDRIDLVVKNGVALEDIIDYLRCFIDNLELKINRLAFVVEAIGDTFEKLETEELYKRLAIGVAYHYSNDVFEWGKRDVSRQQWTKDGETELVNVGQNLHGSSESGRTSLFIETDINTLAENNNERFNIDDCESFFKRAESWNEELFNSLKELINNV